MSTQLKEAPPVKVIEPPPAPVSQAYDPVSAMYSLWERRELMGILIRRDFLGRYRGSLLGMLWPMINPLGHLLLYTFVFSVILKVRFGGDASTANFALYLMAGLLPWSALAEAISRSTTCILEVPNLVKKVVFPLEILPVVPVVSSIMTAAISITLLVITAGLYTGKVHATVLILPFILITQALLMGGMCWFLASLGVYIRDIRHMISLALSVWMFTTPIVYPASAFPPHLQFMLWLNPMAGMVTDHRRVIIEGLQPDWLKLAAYTVLAVTAWFAGNYFFMKTKRSFADVM
ncbi:MAG TPA: ABC transporter permease [Candidatus Obscuribacterales bacterium]